MTGLAAFPVSTFPAPQPQTLRSENVLRWQPLPCMDFFCELHSPDEIVLESAELLFGAQQSTPAAPVSDSSPVLRWRISKLLSTDEIPPRPWRIENLNSEETNHSISLQRALTFIEYSTVQALVDSVKNPHLKESPCADAIFAIHGALLCKNDCAIVVVGPSEAGKSTLSCGLWQNGWSVLSDDFSFFQNENRAFPAPRRVSLRSGSRALVGEEIWTRIQNAPSSFQTEEGWLFHPHEISATPRALAADGVLVQAFVFLNRMGGSATSLALQHLNPALAAMALLPYGTLLPRGTHDELGELQTNEMCDWGVALPRIAAVAGRVPVYDLGRGPLPEMVAAVETLTKNIE